VSTGTSWWGARPYRRHAILDTVFNGPRTEHRRVKPKFVCAGEGGQRTGEMTPLSAPDLGAQAPKAVVNRHVEEASRTQS